MPTHFHLLLKQETDNGIRIFLSNLQNSYARYFNIKHSHSGPLLTPNFKAVHIETDEQLLHVTRYIHLNPYSSSLVKHPQEAVTYPNTHINYSLLLDITDLNQNQYHQLVLDQAHYQRELETIKHLTLED